MTHLLPFIGIIVLCLTGGVYLWVSRINQFFFFGRTLSEESKRSAAAQRVVKRYLAATRVGLFVSLSLYAFMRIDLYLRWNPSMLIGILLQYIFFLLAYTRAHREAGTIAPVLSSANPEEGQPTQPVSVSLLPAEKPLSMLQMLLPALVAAVVWIVVAQFRYSGFVAFGDAVEAFGGGKILGMSLGMLTSSTGLTLLLRFAARHRTSLAQRTQKLLLTMGWIGAAMFAAVAITVVKHVYLSPMISAVLVGTVFAFVILQVIYTWIRSKRFAPSATEMRGNDENWRWGMCYYNPADPALFVQSRCHPGYTLNFANVFSWPVALAIYGDLGFLFFLGIRR